MPHNTASARSSRAFLAQLDNMPSANDFAAAIDFDDADADAKELEVPPLGQIPELEAESSVRAWLDESDRKDVG